MDLHIRSTRDGSHTIYSEHFDQHYHNPNGAISESRQVFFEPAKIVEKLKTRPSLNILEIGFGTGLNLLLLADLMIPSPRCAKVIYQSVEAYPITSDIAQKLNYCNEIGNSELKGFLPEIFNHLTPGKNSFQPITNLEVRIFYGLFEDMNSDDFKADVIFFDAFSPNVNPDLWTDTVFRTLKQSAMEDVVMTTYCAATRARAAMASAGWFVARAPGALGKREMTIAALTPEPLKDYKRVNEQRLAERYNSGDFNS
ncbi:MAG TPA: tRNA (5-methylaminomethyl-2-thiouridine)(34)-methyltransferase MnmD [Balneolales bacterium]|nr:tRNA (5-methylaminomethyl-2-thiouridine)(34)-methyltransferase MnmD [Balneolales bacterium]